MTKKTLIILMLIYCSSLAQARGDDFDQYLEDMKEGEVTIYDPFYHSQPTKKNLKDSIEERKSERAKKIRDHKYKDVGTKLRRDINEFENELEKKWQEKKELQEGGLIKATQYIAKNTTSIMTSVQHYTLNAYKELSKSYHGIYVSIVIILLSIIMLDMVYGKTPDYLTLIRLSRTSISVVIVSWLVFADGVFEPIYKGLTSSVLGISNFFLALGNNFSDVAGDTQLEKFINGIGGVFVKLAEASEAYLKQSSILKDLVVVVGAGVLMLFALFVFVISVTTLLLALVFANVMVALMPIGISLLPFPQTRHIGRSNIMLFIKFSCTSVIIAIVLGMVMSYVTSEINSLIPDVNGKIKETSGFLAFFLKTLFLLVLTYGLIGTARGVANNLFDGGSSYASGSAGGTVARRIGAKTYMAGRGAAILGKRSIEGIGRQISRRMR